MLRIRSLAKLAAVAVVVFGAPPALAIPRGPPTAAELSQAREQFALGRKLEDEGLFSEALGIFQRVGEVKMTPQVRFHIALCLESTGRLVEALETFRLAATEAGTAAPNVVKEANEHLSSLEKRIPTLTLVLTSGAPDDELTLDGKPVATQTSVPVDPGLHTVAVLHAGKIVREQTITLEESKGLRMELSPPAPEPPKEPEKPPVGPVGPVEKKVEVDPSTGKLERAFGWTAIGVASLSAVGLGVSAGLRAQKLSELEAACPTLTKCGHDVTPIVNDGQTFSTMVNVFAATTGATAVAGVVLLLSAPSPAIPATKGALELRVGPVFMPGNAFVSLEGRF